MELQISDSNYLKNIIIISPAHINEDIIKADLMKPLDFAGAKAEIEASFLKILEKQSVKQCDKINRQDKELREWRDCINECKTSLNKYIAKEISSTAYILRVLAQSVISISDHNINIVFNLTIPKGEVLTGIWNEDKKYFSIKLYGSLEEGLIKNASGRLIMGFGPSASGKTYWTKNIIR